MPRITLELTEPSRVDDHYEVVATAIVTEQTARRKWDRQPDMEVQFYLNAEPSGDVVITDGQGRATKRFSGLAIGNYRVEAEIFGTSERAEQPLKIEVKARKIGTPNFDADGDDGNWLITGFVPDENNNPVKDYPVLVTLQKWGRRGVEEVELKTGSDGYVRYRLIFSEPECLVRVRTGPYEKSFTLYGPPAHPRPPRYFLTRGEDALLNGLSIFGSFGAGWALGRDAYTKMAGSLQTEAEERKAALSKELDAKIEELYVEIAAGRVPPEQREEQERELQENYRQRQEELERAADHKGLRQAFRRRAHRFGFGLASNNNYRAGMFWLLTLFLLIFNLLVVGFGPAIEPRWDTLDSVQQEYLTAMYEAKGLEPPLIARTFSATAGHTLRWIFWGGFFLILFWSAFYTVWASRDEISRARREVARHFRERTGSIAEGPQPAPSQAASQQGQPSPGGWLRSIANIGRRVRDDFVGSFLANWFTH